MELLRIFIFIWWGIGPLNSSLDSFSDPLTEEKVQPTPQKVRLSFIETGRKKALCHVRATCVGTLADGREIIESQLITGTRLTFFHNQIIVENPFWQKYMSKSSFLDAHERTCILTQKRFIQRDVEGATSLYKVLHTPIYFIHTPSTGTLLNGKPLSNYRFEQGTLDTPQFRIINFIYDGTPETLEEAINKASYFAKNYVSMLPLPKTPAIDSPDQTTPANKKHSTGPGKSKKTTKNAQYRHEVAPYQEPPRRSERLSRGRNKTTAH